jgi:hypothetical protein
MRYGDGEPLLRRRLIELKRWIKTKLLHQRPAWPNKENLNKSYPLN